MIVNTFASSEYTCIQSLEEYTQYKGYPGYRRVCALCNDHTHAFSFQIECAGVLGCQMLHELCMSSSDGEGHRCQELISSNGRAIYQVKVDLTLPACEFRAIELAGMWFLLIVYQMRF